MDGRKATSEFGTGPRSQYTVSVFGVDQEGLPFNRCAIKPKTVSSLGIKNNNGKLTFHVCESKPYQVEKQIQLLISFMMYNNQQ